MSFPPKVGFEHCDFRLDEGFILELPLKVVVELRDIGVYPCLELLGVDRVQFVGIAYSIDYYNRHVAAITRGMRAVTQTDADEVARLDAVLFPENCFNEHTLAREIAIGSGWVIYNGMELVGYVLVRDDDLYLDIIRLGVHPDFQRQHLGSAMLKKVLEKNRATMLTVREGNDIALRLYLKYGFQLVGRLHNGLGWVLLREANGAFW